MNWNIEIVWWSVDLQILYDFEPVSGGFSRSRSMYWYYSDWNIWVRANGARDQWDGEKQMEPLTMPCQFQWILNSTFAPQIPNNSGAPINEIE